MDLSAVNTPLISTHPAYLFIGSHTTLLEHAIIELQKILCPSAHPALRQAQDEIRANARLSAEAPRRRLDLEGGCSVCFTCRKIQEQQHESILWLCPEKQYAIDDLKVIFSTISFALEPHHHFFFVLQKADMLTATCANALLKSLEEPPAGYHFILLAQRAELILPTIKSRCLIHLLQSQKEHAPLTALLPFFTSTSFHDPIAFSKELESSNPSEWESLTLLDQLILFWSDHYKKSILANDEKKLKQAEQMIGHLKKALLQPPMPGSGKLFWKNLFLQIKQL